MSGKPKTNFQLSFNFPQQQIFRNVLDIKVPINLTVCNPSLRGSDFTLTNEKHIMKDAGLFQQGDIHR